MRAGKLIALIAVALLTLTDTSHVFARGGAAANGYDGWKKLMQGWLDAANQGKYFENPGAGRRHMGPRMHKDFNTPLKIDWVSFKRAYDKADEKTKKRITRLNLATYCGGFWSGQSYYGSGNSKNKKARAKVRRGVKRAVCFYSTKKAGEYRLITKGKHKGTFRLGINPYSSNIGLNVANEIGKKLKL